MQLLLDQVKCQIYCFKSNEIHRIIHVVYFDHQKLTFPLKIYLTIMLMKLVHGCKVSSTQWRIFMDCNLSQIYDNPKNFVQILNLFQRQNIIHINL